jgi:hypothetical protein
VASALLFHRSMRPWILLCLAACAADPAPTSVQTAQMTRTGGLAPHRDGSSCQPMDETFNFDASTRALTWRICTSPNDTDPFAFHTAGTVLDPTTATQLDTALHDLRATAQLCGGDIVDTVIVDGTTWNEAQCANDAAAFAIVEPLAN